MKEKIKSSAVIVLKVIIFFGFLILLYAGSLYIFKNISDVLAKNILEYIRALAWPVVVLLIAFTFRVNIAQLIERMEEWEIPFVGKGKAHGVLAQQQETIKTDVVVAQNEGEDFKAIVTTKEAEITALKDNSQQLVEKLTRAQIELDFERIYNIIFASQVDLLFKINNFPQVEFAYITDHYTKSQQTALTLLKDWTVFQYIQFLITNQLI
ncbi:MAG: hypothetical protein WCV88_01035 [Patescibacteria group bacterium]